ncbi:MAG: hypothetical protein DRH20_01960 [Deltaproteobacteria bacterium]|nr:MAG: hypothetical protein DRH20_01960 [Deltaproteobacteria bacterium]
MTHPRKEWRLSEKPSEIFNDSPAFVKPGESADDSVMEIGRSSPSPIGETGRSRGSGEENCIDGYTNSA